MNIHCYLLCYNEEDIIKSVLDYYSSFCSKIFIFDNMSSDNSVLIASGYDNVRVVSFDSGGKLDDKLHVKIKTEAYKDYSRRGGRYTEEVADWIICVDMDELIYHPKLIDVLTKYKRLGVTVPQVTGFNMVGREDVSSDLPIIDQYDSGVREPVFDKRAIFDVDFDMAYSPGCHSRGPGFEYLKGLYGYKTSNDYPIALLHYKHIGKRLLDASIKNVQRFSSDDIRITDEGRYIGPGSHYKYYVDKAFKESPFIKHARKIFDEQGNVLFENFPPMVSEKPQPLKSKSELDTGMNLTNKEFDFLRRLAPKLEGLDLESAKYIVRMLLRFRPESEFLNKKYAYYISKEK